MGLEKVSIFSIKSERFFCNFLKCFETVFYQFLSAIFNIFMFKNYRVDNLRCVSKRKIK